MNRLSSEPSAYLRQHAENPVSWWPFGEEAFAEAARRDVPVFLSVGYAACHWCHVMAHESFEDAETARYLNEHFVCIKVDREERPDVDAIYMSATQAITGQGGWPMSVFLLPDGRPFHAGTYFPPAPGAGLPSFGQVLAAVQEAWIQRRSAVESSAAALSANLGRAQQANRALIGPLTGSVPANGPSFGDSFSAALATLEDQEDAEYGGFGGAPKFPPSTILSFLLRYAGTGTGTGTDTGDDAAGRDAAGRAGAMAGRTLEAMATSALYDQLDGGFARYAVDRRWSVPHFEKMLYDNAQLLRLYTQWSRLPAAHQPLARRIAGATADWLLSALQLTGGGFASSLDADTVIDGVHYEGAGYLFTPAELSEVLSEDADDVASFMHVGAVGTVSAGGSALHPGRILDLDEENVWRRAAPLLLAARRKRPAPARDEKVVAGWNGLAIAALADTGLVLSRPELVTAAERCADYLWDVHLCGGHPDGRNPEAGSSNGESSRSNLRRVSFDGVGQGIDGLLEDYSFCAEGFFALYAATGRERWYGRAEQLLLRAEELFLADDGQLRDSAGTSAALQRAQGGSAAADPLDNVTPSGAAAFSSALLTYAGYSGSSRHRSLAWELIGFVPRVAARAPRAVGAALAVAVAALAGPVQVAVVGPDGPRRRELIDSAAGSPVPGLILAIADGPGPDGQLSGPAGPAELSSAVPVPLLTGRTAAPDGAAQAFVCQAMVCTLPTTDPAQLRLQLREASA